MRHSWTFALKVFGAFFLAILFCLLYAAYKNVDDTSAVSRKAPIVIKRYGDAALKKSFAGVNNLFRNVDNSFEDMYNFKVDLMYLTKKRSRKIRYPRHEIEIWGKASVGEYLWGHVFDGNSTTYANGLIRHGETQIDNLLFRFRSGPGIVQTTVPTSVKNLILVLNGKDDVKIKFSKNWLDYLVHFKRLKNVAVVLLGDEKCDNNWILQYLKTRGGVVDLVFLTYDCNLVDNREIFQWPLGVATYRGFPNLKPYHVNTEVARQNLCNFMGTVYRNSSRETLNAFLKKSKICFVEGRDTWVPVETYESMSKYIKTLTESDLTLNPAGQNTECYRIYEALSLGSVPVVENAVTPGDCDRGNGSPLRLLKEHGAPLIYVNDWGKELIGILETESKLALEKKVERRRKVIKWYDKFKKKMKNQFVSVIKRNFFKEE